MFIDGDDDDAWLSTIMVGTSLNLSQGALLEYHHADSEVFDVPTTHSWK